MKNTIRVERAIKDITQPLPSLDSKTKGTN